MNKILKTVTTSVVAASLACTMVFSASAATADDAVQAAKDAGVQSINIVELENFFKTATFTSDEYQLMIDTVNKVKETYVTPLAKELFNKTPAELTEDEKVELGQHWTAEEKQAIINELVELGKKVDVEVDADMFTKSEYHVTATKKTPSTTTSNGTNSTNSTTDGKTSGSTTSTGTGATIGVSNKVIADTGDTAEDSSSVAMAIAGLVALATAGSAVVLNKKSRD